ncbi:hypothetical protein GE061_004543 [Apolygus lucorum]|uniref:CHK kinase-like domain-containing protein n=1 Tax=Apolygus lucorum TaxID=248454 RepID=A0A8S9X3G8_APOLU|nr:hypothetical protein GE061_004543 [Apolygus lucorum]
MEENHSDIQGGDDSHPTGLDIDKLGCFLTRQIRDSTPVKIVEAFSTVAEGGISTNTRRVTATCILRSGKKKKYSIIVKTPVQWKTAIQTKKFSLVFRTEIRSYTIVLPAMEALMDEFDDKREKLWPALYGIENDLIAIEDLAESQFQLRDRKKNLDLPHAMLALRGLARWHAMSMELLRRRWIGENEKGKWKPTDDQTLSQLWKALTVSLSNAMVNNWGEEWQPIGKKLMTHKDDMLVKYHKEVPNYDRRFEVFNHGDLNSQNMMFKYTEYGDHPVAVKRARADSRYLVPMEAALAKVRQHVEEQAKEASFWRTELLSKLERQGEAIMALEARLSASPNISFEEGELRGPPLQQGLVLLGQVMLSNFRAMREDLGAVVSGLESKISTVSGEMERLRREDLLPLGRKVDVTNRYIKDVAQGSGLSAEGRRRFPTLYGDEGSMSAGRASGEGVAALGAAAVPTAPDSAPAVTTVAAAGLEDGSPLARPIEGGNESEPQARKELWTDVVRKGKRSGAPTGTAVAGGKNGKQKPVPAPRTGLAGTSKASSGAAKGKTDGGGAAGSSKAGGKAATDSTPASKPGKKGRGAAGGGQATKATTKTATPANKEGGTPAVGGSRKEEFKSLYAEILSSYPARAATAKPGPVSVTRDMPDGEGVMSPASTRRCLVKDVTSAGAEYPHLNSFVWDLSYLLNVSVDPAVRRDNLAEFFTHYVESLQENLRFFNYVGYVPTLDDVKTEWERISYAHMCHLLFNTFRSAETEHPFHYAKIIDDSPEDFVDKFFDLQYSHLNSFIWDLSYLLNGSVHPAVRRDNLAEFISHYVESLQENLRFFNYVGYVPTLDDVKTEWERISYAHMCHLWLNTTMSAESEHPFNYAEIMNDSPEDVVDKFFDLQYSHLNSFIWDLSFFLNGSVDPAVRRDNLAEFFTHYVESLEENLRFFNYVGYVPTLGDVEAEWKRISYAHMCHLWIIVTRSAENEHPYNFAEIKNDSTEDVVDNNTYEILVEQNTKVSDEKTDLQPGLNIHKIGSFMTRQISDKMPVKIIDSSITATKGGLVTRTDLVNTSYLLRSGKKKKYSMIVKTPMKWKTAEQEKKYTLMFATEIRAYTIVLPAMETLMDEFDDKREKLWPGLYGFEYDLIALEDLTESRFSLQDRKINLDLPHAILALRSMARWHAMSMELLSRGWIGKDDNKKFRSQEDVTMKLMMEGLIASLCNAMESEWGEEWKPIAMKMRTHKEDVINKYHKEVPNYDKKFEVLNHGDLNIENMMFKHAEYGDLAVSVKFFDFQTTHYNSFIWDLSFLLNGSVDPAVRRDNLTSLFTHYVESLQENLKFFNYVGYVPTLDDVETEWERTSFAHMCHLLFNAFRSAECEQPTNLEDLVVLDCPEDYLDKSVFSDGKVKRNMGEDFKYFYTNGIM